MRRPHDNHRRFQVPATNGSRPLARGRLCGGKVSELFRTGEWICRRGNRWREVLDRLLLFGWLLSQRDPIELSCEGVMRRPQVCSTKYAIIVAGVSALHRPRSKFLFSIVFFCSAGCYLNEIPSNCL